MLNSVSTTGMLQHLWRLWLLSTSFIIICFHHFETQFEHQGHRPSFIEMPSDWLIKCLWCSDLEGDGQVDLLSYFLDVLCSELTWEADLWMF